MHDEDIQISSRNLIHVKKKSMPHPFVGALRIPEGLLVLGLECLWLVWRTASMDAPPSSLRRLAAAISAVVVAAQESGLADSEVVSVSKYSDPITTSVPIHSRAYASHRISVVCSAPTLYWDRYHTAYVLVHTLNCTQPIQCPSAYFW